MDTDPFYAEEDLLPLSAVADLLYCARRAALHLVERVWEDNVPTTEGILFHQRVHGQSPSESRGDVRIARSLHIRSVRLGLAGKVDVVEFHRVSVHASQRDPPVDRAVGVPLERAKGLWTPFPVEYKVGRLRNEKGFEVQLCAQGLCLEEMLHVAVPKGALYYGKTGRRLEVNFDERMRNETAQAAARLHELIASGRTPRAEFGKKCGKCSLATVCMPKAVGARRSVASYLAKAVASTDEDTS